MEAKTTNKLMMALFSLSTLLIIFILFSILAYIFIKGARVIGWEFLTEMPRKFGEEGGIYPAILGTLYLVATALVFALPIGVGAAIYFVEFAKESKLTRAIRITVDTLNGIPSIVLGLFGMAFFVYYLRDFTGGVSILSGGLTLGVMVLPTIIRTSEISLSSVPKEYIEASYALGATKLQTIRKIILPVALPGIITGAILSFGRAAGETAPIIFTAAISNAVLPKSPFQPTMALTTHLYFLASEGRAIDKAYGTALVLICIVLISNFIARSINWYCSRNLRG